ncbi:hypothetical protein [uncultured Chitinophaga sp.]|jgi:hypothetical protein|uniref:hypothetical protein n=1 Tax=uncultured Chitinophaga sp. TaxID=339340 RepID=UPI0026352C23|nr:hypothetical protein [uncultured Chitinophaga sp.]
MENKNLNQGTINTDGGAVHIGDNLSQVFEYLSTLLQEYNEQLKSIEGLIKGFKPKTAFNLLENLEERVNALDAGRKEKVQSRLYYLKALCKKVQTNSSPAEVFSDFLRAYQLDRNDKILQQNALLAYVNLKDSGKAIELADSILQYDEYNATAQFCKLVLAANPLAFIKEIPTPVFKNSAFQLNVLHHFLEKRIIESKEEITMFGIDYKDCLTLSSNLTFDNQDRWLMVIDTRYNDFVQKHHEKQLFHEGFVPEINQELTEVIIILEKYIDTLQSTEISDNLYHQTFLLYNLKELTNKGKYLSDLVEHYEKLPKQTWEYTAAVCQLLIRNREYAKSLRYLTLYEENGELINKDFLLLKFLCQYFVGDKIALKKTFNRYLSRLEALDRVSTFNILNTCLRALFETSTEEEPKEYYSLINQKTFTSPTIRDLFQVCYRIRYLRERFSPELFEKLNELKSSDELDVPWKGVLAESLISIGKRGDAINYLDSFINKEEISDILYFYIHSLYQQLLDKEDDERGRYQELLRLLRFWRTNSQSANELFAGFEHNLYTEISDLDNLEEVDKFLIEKFPENERYILAYLSVLENKKNVKEIERIADALKVKYENEKIGVNISGLLLRTGIKEKAFAILYDLASNPLNTIARSAYFANSLMFKEFFDYFDEVKLGAWVILDINGKPQKQFISKAEGFQGELIGRKKGETFTRQAKVFEDIVSVEIIEIFNDATNLFREIIDEAENPLNELGIQKFKLPAAATAAEFEQALIHQFGARGTLEKEANEKLLTDYINYRIGFTEITKHLFRQNHIEAYFYLTNDTKYKFTTIPNGLTAKIDPESHKQFSLDFSTLILFYDLCKQFEITPKHKFLISTLIQKEIENDLTTLKFSTEDSMSVLITHESVYKNFVSEDQKMAKIRFLQSLMSWIEEHCIVDLVKEKLDIVPKLRKNEDIATDVSTEMLTDYMFVSSRENTRLISSDSTLFLFKVNNGLYRNIVNPEKYLLTYHPEKVTTSLYRYLLKSNYLGINISYDTLRNEFFDFLAGKENYYLTCVENLQFSVHGNIEVIEVAAKFLKELYLTPFLKTNDKGLYSLQIMKTVKHGMNRHQLDSFIKAIRREFKLMGHMYDDINELIQLMISGTV